jgi:nucleoside-diphosphate-sugar epimerase
VGFYKENILDWSNGLKKAVESADVIIHLAAMVGAPLCDRYPEMSKNLNLEWVKQLTKRLSKDQHVIFPNTNSGYGSVPDGVCTEETPSNPISLYGKTKQQAEEILLNEHQKTTVFRLATVFGFSPRPRLDLLINNMTYEAYVNKKIEVFDGGNRRNYVHISDVCGGINFALHNPHKTAGNVFNLGNDSINTTKLGLAEQIGYLTDCKVVIDESRTDPDKRDYLVSSEKLSNIGYRAATPLSIGVYELFEYFNYLPKDLPRSMRNY